MKVLGARMGVENDPHNHLNPISLKAETIDECPGRRQRYSHKSITTG